MSARAAVRRRRLRAVVIAVVSILAIGAASPVHAGAVTPAKTCRDPQANTPPTAGQRASARPVVLVHGWTGHPLAPTATMLGKTLGSAISTYQFDYAPYASFWAHDDRIAPCLADYVNLVSKDYRAAGGDGKVIVVAHSMGGNAVRYAFDPAVVATPIATGTVAAVVTLSTPWTGSPFGGTTWARLKEQFLAGDAELPGLEDGDGGTCLAVHRGSQSLPSSCGAIAQYLPAGTPLTQIAGDITVNRKLFGHTMYQLPLSSDGIVPVESSNGYLLGGPSASTPKGQVVTNGSDRCQIDQDVTRLVLADGNPFGILSRAEVIQLVDSYTLDQVHDDRKGLVTAAVFGLATLQAPCSHIHIANDQSAVNQVTAVIRATISRLTPRPPPTQVLTLRPVTSDGQPAGGWSVENGDGSAAGGPSAYCSAGGAFSSSSAVDPDIYYCSPTAASADTCWPASDPSAMLCLQDPFGRTVTRLSVDGSPAPVSPPAHATPIGLVLDNGVHCRLRNGGSWDAPTEQPDWVGYYACDGENALWASRSTTDGIDRNASPWKVSYGAYDAHLVTHTVRTAYLVGTA